MYQWRQLTPDQRDSILEERKLDRVPWHRPPHQREESTNDYLITATCYEHHNLIGKTQDRLASFETNLKSTLQASCAEIYAWCVLPNHYHVLVKAPILKSLRKAIAQLHGRTSRYWNQEDDTPGRQVWHACSSRFMRSSRHFFTSLNYVHHNPVKHGFAAKWEDWPFSSVHQFLKTVDRNAAIQMWRDYPVLDYGLKWDDFPSCIAA